MASRRASLSSLASLRPVVWSSRELTWISSVSLHSGQRLAKPGLSGFSSNSSPQTTQTLMGNGIYFHDNRAVGPIQESHSDNPAAADHLIAIVKNRCLSGGDGALRLIE